MPKVKPSRLSILAWPYRAILWLGRLIFRSRFSFIFITIMLLIGGGGYFYLSELSHEGRARQLMNIMTAKAGFVLRDITLEGRKRTHLQDVLETVNVKPGTPIFAINLAQLRSEIVKLPWVAQAHIARRLPDILHITLQEHEPFALFSDGNKISLINADGEIVTESHLDLFPDLLVISGHGGRFKAKELTELLGDFPSIEARVIAAHWTGQRRWTLRLNHGRQILLPEVEVKNALRLLNMLNEENNLLDNGNQPIDLRVPKRIYLRGYSEADT